MPPSLVSGTAISWWGNGATTDTSSIAVTDGDLLLAWLMKSSSGDSVTLSTQSGSTDTWTDLLASTGANVGATYTTATATGNVVVRYSFSGSGTYGGVVVVVRSTSGVGASGRTSMSGAAPSHSLTTEGANSLVLVCACDLYAGDGTSRTWRENFGSATEQFYNRNSNQATGYVGYHADSGASATAAVGLSAPNITGYVAGVELLAAAAATSILPLVGREMQNIVDIR